MTIKKLEKRIILNGLNMSVLNASAIIESLRKLRNQSMTFVEFAKELDDIEERVERISVAAGSTFIFVEKLEEEDD